MKIIIGVALFIIIYLIIGLIIATSKPIGLRSTPEDCCNRGWVFCNQASIKCEWIEYNLIQGFQYKKKLTSVELLLSIKRMVFWPYVIFSGKKYAFGEGFLFSIGL